VVALPPQVKNQFRGRAGVPYYGYAAQAPALHIEAMEGLSQAVPGGQVEHGNSGQGYDDIAPSQADVQGVGDDRHRGCETHCRVEQASVFIRSVAQEPDVITSGEGYPGDPHEWESERGGHVKLRDVWTAIKAANKPKKAT
jgi:hypothetical protein